MYDIENKEVDTETSEIFAEERGEIQIIDENFKYFLFLFPSLKKFYVLELQNVDDVYKFRLHRVINALPRVV